MGIIKKIISNFTQKDTGYLPSNLGSGKSFEEKRSELGIFEYHEDGFTIKSGNLNKQLKWSDITHLEVYKSDLLTIDRIDMDIVYGDRYITITEDQPGWHQFLAKIEEVFISIPKGWDCIIAHPPFKANRQIIYTKPATNKE